MASICASCGQINLDEARFCSACGHVMAVAHGASEASLSPTIFVGRQRELQALRAHLDGAFAGVGSLVGEAGIGKTSTAREFAAFVRERGLVVLWGSCFEGDWSPPYGPWAEALGEYAQSSDPERLQRELGPSAPPLVQLIPQVRAILPDIPLAAPLPPDEERLRLYEAVGQFFLAIAQDQPTVLVTRRWPRRQRGAHGRSTSSVRSSGPTLALSHPRSQRPDTCHWATTPRTRLHLDDHDRRAGVSLSGCPRCERSDPCSLKPAACHRATRPGPSLHLRR